ncbi:membrane bound O-acyl transferase family-domain-containing protein [Panaeolus papilionaceus]|nr:membrane bound O-acyl transferase family-domain-containing protein [Panaeolus papilionaceus]
MGAERPAFSWVILAIEEALYAVALTIKQPRIRQLLFFPIGGLCTYLALFTASDNVVNNYGMGCHLFTRFFAASDHLLLRSNLHKQLRHINQRESIDKAPFKDRLLWSLKLIDTPRGIGWNFEPTSHLPSRPRSSRRRFLFEKALELVILVLVYDLNGFLNRWNPSFDKNGPSLQQSPWIYRVASIGFAVASLNTIRILHVIYGMVSVAAGVTQPSEWPSIHGSLRCCYSVRNIWGRFWHQNLRQLLTSHSTWIASKMGLRVKGTIKSFTQTLIVFFISGLVHHTGDYMALNRSGGSFVFFMLQSLAIIVEGAAIQLGRKAKLDSWVPTGVWKALGYLWVLTWFSYTLPIMVDPLLRVGFFEDGLSFSVILGLLRGTWSPKSNSS